MSTDLVPIADATELERAADPAAYVVATLERAKAWLAHTLEHGDIESIIELKSQAEAIRVYTMSKQLGKDAELSASEIVRRADRGLGLAIRKGQAEGQILRRGEAATRANQHGPAPLQPAKKSSPAQYFSGGGDMSETYAITDGVTDDQFEEAIAEARAEGNLSRANMARKVKKEGRPVTPPARTQISTAAAQRRAFTAACTTLAGIVHGLGQIEDIHPAITNEEVAEWVGDLSEARLVIERAIRRLKERVASVPQT